MKRLRSLALVSLLVVLPGAFAADAPAPALTVAKFTSDGKLLKPQDLESWVFVGTSLGLGYNSEPFKPKPPGLFQVVQMERPYPERSARESARRPRHPLTAPPGWGIVGTEGCAPQGDKKMKLDRRDFFAKLGGAAAVAAMTHEARADALEHYMMSAAAAPAAASGGLAAAASGDGKPFPTAAELEAQIETRPSRKGVGNLFTTANGNVKRLPPLPEKPTLADYFNLRFTQTSNHCFQSANRAMKNGMSEEIVLACLLHDTVQELIKVDHGWWGAQMYEPYVSPKVTFAIRYHQALRFYEDKEHGYEYPDLYRRMFGVDYKPEPYIEQTWQMVRKHKWYLEPRMVTVNDLYAFDPNVRPTLEQFTDIIGRNFKQPKEGLGFDNSPVAHMWRSIGTPDHPL